MGFRIENFEKFELLIKRNFVTNSICFNKVFEKISFNYFTVLFFVLHFISFYKFKLLGHCRKII